MAVHIRRSALMRGTCPRPGLAVSVLTMLAVLTTQIHFAPCFMTFHRAFNLEFENALLSVVPSLKAMPWWEITKDLNGEKMKVLGVSSGVLWRQHHCKAGHACCKSSKTSCRLQPRKCHATPAHLVLGLQVDTCVHISTASYESTVGIAVCYSQARNKLA